MAQDIPGREPIFQIASPNVPQDCLSGAGLGLGTGGVNAAGVTFEISGERQRAKQRLLRYGAFITFSNL
jgi:hypothetical protein